MQNVEKHTFAATLYKNGPDGESNINSVREDRASRVLVLVLNQQSATISSHFTRLAIAPGQRYMKKLTLQYISLTFFPVCGWKFGLSSVQEVPFGTELVRWSRFRTETVTLTPFPLVVNWLRCCRMVQNRNMWPHDKEKKNKKGEKKKANL